MTSLMDDFLDSVVYDEPVENWDIPAMREDPDDDWVEKALRDAIDVVKAGTIEGAKKAWLIRRRRQIEDLRARAVAIRDGRLLAQANAMAQSMARLQQASLVIMHLPSRHDQQTHAHGGKTEVSRKYVTDDVLARLPAHIQNTIRGVVPEVRRGKAYYNPLTKKIHYDPKQFADIETTSSDQDNVRVEKTHEKRFGETTGNTYSLVVDDVGAHLLQQTVQHEIGHHVWHELSKGDRQKVDSALKAANQSKFKDASKSVRQYLDSGTYDWGEEGQKFSEDRIREEMFADAVRWKQSKSLSYESVVPVAVRRIIDGYWLGKVSKSESYVVELISKAESDILLNIAENGAHLDDVFWEQFKVEINRLVHRGYAYFTDTSGGGPGYANRTVTLTRKGIDALAMWRRETGGRLQSLVANILGGMK